MQFAELNVRCAGGLVWDKLDKQHLPRLEDTTVGERSPLPNTLS